MKRTIAFFASMLPAMLFAVDVVEVKIRALDAFGGDTSSVISRCQTKAGEPYDPVTVTRDVGSLRESGEFEDISADAKRLEEGVEVTFYVKRKMRYRAPATVDGAEFFGASRIMKESELKDGYLYGEADLAAAAARIRTAYNKKHFPDAKVVPLATAVGDGNDCTVTFVIDEGERVKVRDFVFAGCESVDEKKLRDAIGDYPWWNPMGWFFDAPATAAQLYECREKIATVFRDEGFLDVSVEGPERVPAGDGKADMRFTIDEGAKYTIGEMRISGLTRYPEAAVREKSELPEAGEIAGAKTLADAAHRIEVVVGSGDSGLADTHVEVKRFPSAADPTVLDIEFAVEEGVPVVIDEVRIVGNDYTKDKVIRREISLAPGDRMLADRAETSQRRLENLDYFKRVRYYLESSGAGKDANGAEYRNLVYEVEEKNTGSFMVGLGASSVDSVYVTAEVSQSNFDIFAPGKLFRGGGQKGRLYVAAGPRIQTYEASVTEPHFLGRLLELTVEGYRRQRWYDEYDLVRSGAGASLSYPVKFWPTWEPFGRFGFRLGGEYIEFDDVDNSRYYGKRIDEDDEGRRIFKEEARKYGDAAEGVLRFFWSHDSRDNFRIPTSGSRTQLFADLAGGDNEYWRVGFNHRNYFNVWKRYNHVLMVAWRGETIDSFDSGDVPIYNRMFLGGPRSIRGVEYRNVSPLRRKVKRDDWAPWGGQTLFCANFEYTVPIVKMLRLAVFSDVGSVAEDEFDFDFGDTLAWTAGLGIRLDIPMFPIRLDFATPIEKPKHSEKEIFSFTVGYDF
ncbi:MAG: outer membrane protein assembly factor BamA [Kiritimatiellae bacterium]|nr:outer membrane protein assembly factor BamA [Kiritimatiellia bacterium]